MVDEIPTSTSIAKVLTDRRISLLSWHIGVLGSQENHAVYNISSIRAILIVPTTMFTRTYKAFLIKYLVDQALFWSNLCGGLFANSILFASYVVIVVLSSFL